MPKNKIDKIIVFGCSYSKGTELVQKYQRNKPKWAKETFGEDLSSNGSIEIENRKKSDYEIYYDIERDNPDWEHDAEKLTNSYIAFEELGISEYKNYSVGGYGNTAIFADIMKRQSEIDDNTLVIVNFTYPFRSTRLNQHWDTKTDHPKYKNFSNHKFTKELLDDKIEEALHLFESVDDISSRYAQAYGFMKASIALCKNIIILDPICLYREVPDLIKRPCFDKDNANYICHQTKVLHQQITRESDDYRTNLNPELTAFLQSEFNKIVFPKTFAHIMVDLKEKKEYYRCVLSHPNWKVHEQFAKKYLIPYIKENYNV